MDKLSARWNAPPFESGTLLRDKIARSCLDKCHLSGLGADSMFHDQEGVRSVIVIDLY
jgi:hypothetical protein